MRFFNHARLFAVQALAVFHQSLFKHHRKYRKQCGNWLRECGSRLYLLIFCNQERKTIDSLGTVGYEIVLLEK